MNKNTRCIYRGPSMIDGAPIVVLMSGLTDDPSNKKTGPLLQTWILREDMHPIEALKTGKDSSICGGCEHRPEEHNGIRYRRRSCYVRPSAFSSPWNSYRNGNVAQVALEAIPSLVAGRKVRLGSYGDPAAVPVEVWEAVVSGAEGWTGYSHQYRSRRLQGVLRFCQVSADTLQDAEAAREAGVGSFRVIAEDESPAPFETLCPADGDKVTCATCMACHGAGAAHIAIPVHGIGKGSFAPRKTRRPVILPVLA